MLNQTKNIAVDFDGVLHAYTLGWQNGNIYDSLVRDASDAIERLINKGYKIIVFTTRENTDEVKEWLLRRIGFELEVTNKKPLAIAYIDDRAIRFTNWKDIINYF